MLYLLKARFIQGAEPVYDRAARHGRMVPQGVRFIDSWIIDDDRFDTCYALAETDNPERFDDWYERWSDLVAFEALPVIKSKQAAARAGHPWDGDDRPSAPLFGD